MKNSRDSRDSLVIVLLFFLVFSAAIILFVPVAIKDLIAKFLRPIPQIPFATDPPRPEKREHNYAFVIGKTDEWNRFKEREFNKICLDSYKREN